MKQRYSLWHYGFLLLLLAFSLVYTLPNGFGESPAVQITARGEHKLPPGIVDRVKATLETKKIPYTEVNRHDKDVEIRFADAEKQLHARDALKKDLGRQAVIALNLVPNTPGWLRALGAEPMKLGLDLRGGVHFLLDVDVETVIQAKEQGDLRSMKSAMREEKIRYVSFERPKAHRIIIGFRDAEHLHRAQKVIITQFGSYHMQANEAGTPPTLTLDMDLAALNQLTNYAIDQTITILNNRVNELGVSEAVVQRQGLSQISVDLPGVQDPARAKELLGKTATLRFHLVDTRHDALAALSEGAPDGSRLYKDEAGRPILLFDEPILTGSSITYASTSFSDGRPAVSIHLGGGNEGLFHRKTAENVGQPLAVVYVESELQKTMVNGKPVTKRLHHERVISVATIQSPLGNNFEINGLHTQEYAANLALLLRSGALAAPIAIVQELTVGPSLGAANIHKGILSLKIGFALVIFFMLAYYRLFGLVANLALLFNVVLIVAVLSLMGATLTLPGIAGIVLTVGMAVDANVLINERIREEMRLGLSPIASIDAGYERAFATIVDANVTTLIVALILFSLGSGSVKGFAITLTIGLITSMITSVSFTRAIIQLLYRREAQPTSLSIGV